MYRLRRVRIAALMLVVTGLSACSSDGGSGAPPTAKGCEATVHVFVQTNASEQRERRIGQVIDGAPNVVDWTFHTKKEAYREFKRLYKKQPEIYGSKEPSDFPSRFEVTLSSTQDLDLFERTLVGATTGVDRIVPGGCATESPS